LNKSLSKVRGLANPLFSHLPQVDKVASRQRVLARVYGLLMRLAEETEKQTLVPDIADDEIEMIVEPGPVQLDLL